MRPEASRLNAGKTESHLRSLIDSSFAGTSSCVLGSDVRSLQCRAEQNAKAKKSPTWRGGWSYLRPRHSAMELEARSNESSAARGKARNQPRREEVPNQRR